MLDPMEIGQARSIAEECGVSPGQKQKVIKKLEKLDECIIVNESQNMSSIVQVFNFTDLSIGLHWRTLAEKEEIPAKNSTYKQFDTTTTGETTIVIYTDGKEFTYTCVLEKNKIFQYHVYEHKIEEVQANIDPDTYRNSEVFVVTAQENYMTPLTKNFFDAFDKNGRYFCESMEDYVPPEASNFDSFLVDFYKTKYYETINAQNLRSGKQYIAIKFNDALSAWFPGDCGRLPTYNINTFQGESFIDIEGSSINATMLKAIYPTIEKTVDSKIWVSTPSQDKMNGRIKFSDGSGDTFDPVVDSTKIYVPVNTIFALDVEILTSRTGIVIRIDITNNDGTMIEIRLKAKSTEANWVRIGTDEGTFTSWEHGWKGNYICSLL